MGLKPVETESGRQKRLARQAAAEDEEKSASNKRLILYGGIAFLVVVFIGGVWWFVNRKRGAESKEIPGLMYKQGSEAVKTVSDTVKETVAPAVVSATSAVKDTVAPAVASAASAVRDTVAPAVVSAASAVRDRAAEIYGKYQLTDSAPVMPQREVIENTAILAPPRSPFFPKEWKVLGGVVAKPVIGAV